MGARRVHDHAIQQVEKAVMDQVNRLQELIQRGPDNVGQMIIAEVAKEGYIDNPAPEASPVLAEIVDELEALRTLGKRCTKLEIQDMIWEVDENLDGHVDWHEMRLMFERSIPVSYTHLTLPTSDLV